MDEFKKFRQGRRELIMIKMLGATVFLLISYSVFVDFAGSTTTDGVGFSFNGGFRSANLSLDVDGTAEVTNNGLLRLTNGTLAGVGHAFYPNPINFKTSSNGEAFSFSTTFVFAVRSPPQVPSSSSTGGLAFVIAPSKLLPVQGSVMPFLGLFNMSTNGSASSHIFAVEFDTVTNDDTNDIKGNHVAIDINTINSIIQNPSGYYPNDDHNLFDNLTLSSGLPLQVWVDYDGARSNQINVTIAPFIGKKPIIPLLNLTYDLSQIFEDTMYVGFSASNGPVATNYFILGWSFGSQSQTEMAQQLDLSKLPKLPRMEPRKVSKLLTRGLPLFFLLTISAAVFIIGYYVRRKKKFAEVLEDWEVEYGPQRFKYRDLYTATKGFTETELLGAGGFGKVYKGVLPTSKLQIAVKKISHESRQGIREFVTEIVSIGRMSHRNIVPLLGYCRRKTELLLVYEYMPNGSLDKFLYFPHQKFTLSWAQRFQIIKGVASGLFYLHEGWEQVVIHRDIKASNILLDGELNARLGDFGLAKLHNHGSDPQTTYVVGTVGYLAPEHCRTGRATTSTDVYSFGAFLLEVVCGKRPIELRSSSEDLFLVEWVFGYWNEGRIVEAVDRNLGGDFVKEEAELVLKLGLLCSSSEAMGRPSMHKVMLYLDGSMALQDLCIATAASGSGGNSFRDVPSSLLYGSSTTINIASSRDFSYTEMSLLSGGR